MKIDYRNIQKTFRAASIMEAARSCLSILVTEVRGCNLNCVKACS